MRLCRDMPLKLNGWSAYISCDGSELEMFDMKQDDEKTMSCWIASRESVEFCIHWEQDPPQMRTAVEIYIDGLYACGYVHEDELSGSCSSVYDTAVSTRTLKFAPLLLTEDDTAATAAVHRDLGSIIVRVTRVKRFVPTGKPPKGSKFSGTGPVHEKSKKAGVHAVSTVGYESHVLATSELLRANGVAPRASQHGEASSQFTTSLTDDLAQSVPTQSGSKRKRKQSEEIKPELASDDEDGKDDDDADDVTFLEEQLVMLQKRLAEKRAKKKAKVHVKRETSPIRVPPSSSNEVIDLT
ncbi:hypothetical protein BD413DRAFT_620056 [Trametes elegans]|nr:hypothetical protein BD413DRAFT_620056 [Trametes elegans]